MKMNKLVASLTLVLASGVALQVARADGTDLILGFQSTSAPTYDYLVDLGLETSFTTTTPTETFANVTSSNLISSFGGSSGIRYFVTGTNAVAAGGNPGSTFYITDLGGTPGNQSGTNVENLAEDSYSIYSAYDSGTSAGTNQVTESASNDSNSLTQLFGTNDNINSDFNYTTYQTTPASGSNTLKLFEFTDVNSSNAPTLLGTFTFNSSNDSLSFTGSAAAVPEPSTYVLLAIGVAGLYFGTRRKGLTSV